MTTGEGNILSWQGNPPYTPIPTPTPKKERAKKILKTFFVVILVGALISALGLIVAYNAIQIPNANAAYEKETSFVYYRGGKDEIGRYIADSQDRDSLPYEEIPQLMRDAAVAAEDRTFWENSGIDVKGILRAVVNNNTGGAQSGASTITQQYVKNLYLTQERTYTRKVKEAIISLKISRQKSKEDILAGYLNTIYFGRGAYGVEAASNAYFGKPAADINLREAATLAAILNDPNDLDPSNGEEAVAELDGRYRYVINSMVKMGMVDQAEGDKAKESLPKFKKPRSDSRYGGQKGHALKMVRDELLRLKDEQGNPLVSEDEINGGGLRITTTLTKKTMKTAREAVEDVRPEDKLAFDPGNEKDELHVGAATVDVKSGALRGFYGGQDYLDSQINWASTGAMAGSTMKAFTMAAALKSGYSLKDSWNGNSPMQFPGVSVRNSGQSAADPYGHSYGANVSSLKAMEDSINTAFVDMSDSLPNGSEDVYDMALAAGLPPKEADAKHPGIGMTTRDFEPDDFLLTLGKNRTSPINMANAYATIANGGTHNDVHVVSKVVDADGTVIYERDDKGNGERVMDEDVAADTSYSLQQVVSSGTGQAAGAVVQPAAGKTGTATNDKDEVSSAWFVGYTPQLATAVAYTRGDGDDALDGWLDTFFGADYPADTWVAIMGPLTDELEREEFPPPAWLDGDAPEEGHAPYVPPAPDPEPTKEPEPTKKPSPSKEPEPTPTPTPPPTPTPTTDPPDPELPTPSEPEETDEGAPNPPGPR
ncbi:transglycosylase domain-containing protein [Nocardioides sp. NPDC006273]|uniref:transglycosylase domain-containing protein n=1 Tax=Nocardioides sp. NPDC006273 TaxID=3155598 RepID=UPI0033B6498B